MAFWLPNSSLAFLRIGPTAATVRLSGCRLECVTLPPYSADAPFPTLSQISPGGSMAALWRLVLRRGLWSGQWTRPQPHHQVCFAQDIRDGSDTTDLSPDSGLRIVDSGGVFGPRRGGIFQHVSDYAVRRAGARAAATRFLCATATSAADVLLWPPDRRLDFARHRRHEPAAVHADVCCQRSFQTAGATPRRGHLSHAARTRKSRRRLPAPLPREHSALRVPGALCRPASAAPRPPTAGRNRRGNRNAQ